MNLDLSLEETYKEALDFCLKYHKEPLGLTNIDPPKISEGILIKQNNLIIALLLSLHKKIESFEKGKGLNIDIESDLRNITGQLSNLSFKETGKERITRKFPKEFRFQK